jgi:hypothetical protein
MRRTILGSLLAAATVFVSGSARAAAPACAGTLSGSVTGKFECVVSVTTGEADKVYLTIAATTQVEGVPSLVPGSFEVTGLLRPGTYELSDLGMGKASVAAEGGVLYTATRTTGQRGEVKLTFKKVETGARGNGAPVVHGAYRARLIPAGGGKTGEVIVEVKF